MTAQAMKEAPQRGRVLVTVDADDARYEEVVEILSAEGSIERDDRADA
jgi:hypothetical protein